MTPDERRERAEQLGFQLFGPRWAVASREDRESLLARMMAFARDAEARGWEEASACLGKRATYYGETQEVDRFTRAIQLNEVRGCIDALKQGAKQLREGT